MNKSTDKEPTNPLFIKLKALKFKDLVDLRTIQIVHEANQHQLPHGIQKLFQIRENKHNLRGMCTFKKLNVLYVQTQKHTAYQSKELICGTAVGKT